MHETFSDPGPAGPEALAAALTEIAARHEVLRTRYVDEDGSAVQVIDEPEPVKPEFTDLSGVPDDRREQSLRAVGGGPRPYRDRPAPGPPWRVAVVRLAPEESALLLTFHHIAFDGWSWGLLADELRVLYGARSRPATPRRWSRWRSSTRTTRSGSASGGGRSRSGWRRQLDYWREQLAGTSPLELPTDRPRPAVWDATGDTVGFTVPGRLASRFTALAKDAGRHTLHGRAGRVSAAARRGTRAGRHRGRRLPGRPERARLEQLVGMFLNTVVLRAELDGASDFRGLLCPGAGHDPGRLQPPGGALRTGGRRPGPEREPTATRSSRPASRCTTRTACPFSLPGLEVSQADTGARSSAFDLSLHLTERPDGSIAGEFIYPTALFDRDRIERMAENFLHLLDQVVAGAGHTGGPAGADRPPASAPRSRPGATAGPPRRGGRSGRGLVRAGAGPRGRRLPGRWPSPTTPANCPTPNWSSRWRF